MAQKKKITTRRTRRVDTEEDTALMPPSTTSDNLNITIPNPPMGGKRLMIAVLVILLAGGLLYITRSWYLAATINGKPVFRWDLNRVMTARFGQQTLEGMISEALIEEEAAKLGVQVSATDVSAKEDNIVKNLGGGVKLEDLLKFQGITKEDFDHQVRLQLLVQKILGRDIVITDSDADMFIASSSGKLTATEPGALREEAKQAILDTKIGEKVQEWFTALKEKAQIIRFIK